MCLSALVRGFFFIVFFVAPRRQGSCQRATFQPAHTPCAVCPLNARAAADFSPFKATVFNFWAFLLGRGKSRLKTKLWRFFGGVVLKLYIYGIILKIYTI